VARILIFAKAPVPGQVKTRLIPVLGPEGAAALQARLLRDLIVRLGAPPPVPLELWCAPNSTHPLFQELACCHPLTLHRQLGRDLGERLRNAACDASRRAAHLILIGADCPLLDGEYLQRALLLLANGQDAVLGPAEDGGYVLLGLRCAAAPVFTEMPWGSERVAALTRERFARLGWRWAELPTLWDLDRPEDLVRFADLAR